MDPNEGWRDIFTCQPFRPSLSPRGCAFASVDVGRASAGRGWASAEVWQAAVVVGRASRDIREFRGALMTLVSTKRWCSNGGGTFHVATFSSVAFPAKKRSLAIPHDTRESWSFNDLGFNQALSAS